MSGFYIIAACDENMGIGFNNTIPWKLKNEMQHFKKVTSETSDPTKKNVVIMGRSTWESLPEKFRPLPGRKNILLTTKSNYSSPGAITFSSLEEALGLATSMVTNKRIETVFVIGGQKVYEKAINHPDLEGIYLTKILAKYECDAHFPQIPATFSKVKKLGEAQENDVKYEFLLYSK